MFFMDGQQVGEVTVDEYFDIFSIGRRLGYSDVVLDDINLFEVHPKGFIEMLGRSDLSEADRVEYEKMLMEVRRELYEVSRIERSNHDFVEAGNEFLSGLLRLVGL